jgi:hypothetical protein
MLWILVVEFHQLNADIVKDGSGLTWVEAEHLFRLKYAVSEKFNGVIFVLQEGADTPVWLATLDNDKCPTGKFLRRRKEVSW